MAHPLADCVIQASTDFVGTERAPMRIAEARIAQGVVAAREGDLEHAVELGGQALSSERKSLPSLIMVSRDLTRVLNERYPQEQATTAYLEELSAVSQMSIRPALHAKALGLPDQSMRQRPPNERTSH